MTELVIIGGSGHAGVVIDAAKLQGKYNPVAVLANPAQSEANLLGVPVIGGDECLPSLIEQYPGLQIIIAIGDNQIRKKLAAKIAASHPTIKFATIIHPTAIIAPGASIDQGSFIAAGVIINNAAKIAAHVIINTGSVIEHDCSINQFAFIGPKCAIAGNVAIGADAMIGIGTSIIENIQIGEEAVIGAGSSVISNIPAKSKYAGVPARNIQTKH